jgi:hypothetical protein
VTCQIKTSSLELEDQFAVISCDPNVAELHEIFIRCMAVTAEQLPAKANTSDLQTCFQSLLDLFRNLSRPSGREVTGLWAELFIILKSKDVEKAMLAWRRDQFERFDFSWSKGCLEVKSTVKEQRQHEFSTEQLQAPLEGKGYVASVRLQLLGGGIGVLDLAHKIEDKIKGNPDLRQKLWVNIIAALGSDFSQQLDRKYDESYADRNLIVYSMNDIPSVGIPTDPRITAVRFRVDLSDVKSSLNHSSKTIIEKLFLELSKSSLTVDE